LLVQRNYLLKRVRDGVAQVEELDPWDEKLTAEGGLILAQRVAAVSELSKIASLDYRQLADGDEVMHLEYISSLALPESIGDGDFVGKEMRSTLIKNREKEIRAGFTTVGPHRDDLRLLVTGMNVAQYASRGQARTAVLALRLAEGRYLSERRGEPPVLLLDDVLSELDKRRRRHVLEQVAGYEQVFITTAELELLDDEELQGITYYQVGEGKLAKK
jgi:DNA replication and repair protein RecF